MELAADPAGSSFFGRRDSSAMESYDVIANQPVVIDNVSFVFLISKGIYALLPKGVAFWLSSLGRRLFVTGPACQAGSAAASFILSPPVVRRQGGRSVTMVWRTLGWIKGRAVIRTGSLGPWLKGP